MKLPRDVSGEDLSRRLSRVGYTVVRQTGSHMSLNRSAPNGSGMVSPVFGSARDTKPLYML